MTHALLRTLAALCFVAAAPISASADDAKATDTFIEFGAGSAACALWKPQDASKSHQIEQWIVGFWSGINLAQTIHGSSGNVGVKMTKEMIIAEVRATCRRDLKQTIDTATQDVYAKHMQAEVGTGS